MGLCYVPFLHTKWGLLISSGKGRAAAEGLILGFQALICVFLDFSGTTVARILYYIPSERQYFCLSNSIIPRRFKQKILKISIFEQGYLSNHIIY